MKFLDDKKLKKYFEDKNISENIDLLISELDSVIEKTITNHANKIRNQKRKDQLDLFKKKFLAKDHLNKEQISNLPSFLKEEIDSLEITGNTKKTLISSNGKKYNLDNKLNDLSGAEWSYFLRSVINTRYQTSGIEGYAHKTRKIHPSPKPPQLIRDLIKFFTKENDLILDYFMGVGGTLLGASLCNRKALGIELNKTFIEAYKKANEELGLIEQQTICGDSIKLLHNKKLINEFLGDKLFSLIAIDPPYGNMMSRVKTGEAIKKKQSTLPTPYTDKETDLGNMESEKFIRIFLDSIIQSSVFLKKNGHFIVFIKDLQPKDGQTNQLHALLIEEINKIENLKYIGLKIWVDESINLYPYGYPHSFVSNQLHQYILFFKKV